MLGESVWYAETLAMEVGGHNEKDIAERYAARCVTLDADLLDVFLDGMPVDVKVDGVVTSYVIDVNIVPVFRARVNMERKAS